MHSAYSKAVSVTSNSVEVDESAAQTEKPRCVFDSVPAVLFIRGAKHYGVGLIVRGRMPTNRKQQQGSEAS